MGSQWRGALRTRYAIADLMKSCWYSNATAMVLASTELFIIRSSFPAHLGHWFEQPKCISRVKNERTFVLVNTRVPFFQNSCPWFSSWHDLFAFWQQAWRQRYYDSNLFLVVAVLLLITKTWLNPANGEWEGVLGAFCLCKGVNGWRPLDLMEMNRELWEWPCKCTSTTLVSGGPFPVARWIITMFLPRVRVLMWGAFGPPQVLFTAMIYPLKEQTGPDKTIWFRHLITS